MTERKGSLYLPVLATCLIATLLAGTTLMLLRVRRASLTRAMHENQAKYLSMAGLASVREGIVIVPNWRTLAVNGVYSTTFAYQTGNCTVEIRDPDDGDLTDNDAEPYLVRCTGIVGESRFQSEMLLQDRSTPTDALQAELAVGGALSLTNATVMGDGVIWANGPVVATGSSVGLDLASGAEITGTTFLRSASPNQLSRALPSPDAIFNTLSPRATTLATYTFSNNLCPNSGFESTSSPWTDNGLFASVQRSGDQAYEGSKSLLVRNRIFSSDGPELATTFIESGKSYRVALRLYHTGSSANRYRVYFQYTKSGSTKKLSGEWFSCNNSWTSLTHDFTFSDTGISNVKMRVESESGSSNFYIDAVEILEKKVEVKFENGLITPVANTFGAINAEGIYLIDCQNMDLTIQSCRIRGTLLIKDPGPNSKIGPEPVSIVSASANLPAIVVHRTAATSGNSLTISTNGNLVNEATASVNFNPTGEPHPDGTVDTDTVDVYDNRIHGGVIIAGGVTMTGVQRFNEPVIITGTASISGKVEFESQGWLRRNGVPWLPTQKSTFLLGAGPVATGG